jgi:hypothetical protein
MRARAQRGTLNPMYVIRHVREGEMEGTYCESHVFPGRCGEHL